MAFDFPASPSEGQEFTPPVAGAPTYVYEAPRWKSKGQIQGISTSDAPPANPVSGQLWWESDTGNMFVYYTDANSSQWVQLNGSPIPDAPADGNEYVRVNGVWQRPNGYEFIAKGIVTGAPVGSLNFTNLGAFIQLRITGWFKPTDGSVGRHLYACMSVDNGAAYDYTTTSYGIQLHQVRGAVFDGSSYSSAGFIFSNSNAIGNTGASVKMEMFNFNAANNCHYIASCATIAVPMQYTNTYNMGYYAGFTPRNAFQINFATGGTTIDVGSYYVLEGLRV